MGNGKSWWAADLSVYGRASTLAAEDSRGTWPSMAAFLTLSYFLQERLPLH